MLIHKKIMRVYCPLCGYIKEYDPNDLNVFLPSICPACQDGKIKAWENKTVKKSHPEPWDFE